MGRLRANAHNGASAAGAYSAVGRRHQGPRHRAYFHTSVRLHRWYSYFPPSVSIFLIIGMSLLRTHDVAKIFEFNADNSAIEWGGSASTHRVYFVHASTKAAKAIAAHWMVSLTCRMSTTNHLQAHQSNESARFDIFGNERKMTVVFIPRRLNVCEHIFEQAGLINVSLFNEAQSWFQASMVKFAVLSTILICSMLRMTYSQCNCHKCSLHRLLMARKHGCTLSPRHSGTCNVCSDNFNGCTVSVVYRRTFLIFSL